jgi:hypothetical protein
MIKEEEKQMTKPLIELIKCDSGDWSVLRVNSKEECSGHEIPDIVWLELLENIGYETVVKWISDEDMENERY